MKIEQDSAPRVMRPFSVVIENRDDAFLIQAALAAYAINVPKGEHIPTARRQQANTWAQMISNAFEKAQ